MEDCVGESGGNQREDYFLFGNKPVFIEDTRLLQEIVYSPEI